LLLAYFLLENSFAYVCEVTVLLLGVYCLEESVGVNDIVEFYQTNFLLADAD